jgi:hypothetical protein
MNMRWKQTLSFAVAGGAFAAWMAGAAMSTRGVPVTRVAEPTPVELQGAALEAEILRLRERLRPTSVPQGGRNLFDFGTSPTPRARTTAREPSAEPPRAAPADAVAASPPLALIGLAEDREGDRLVRTAIVSGFGDVFLVKEGEEIGDRYQIESIGPDAAVLLDRDTRSTTTLRLK